MRWSIPAWHGSEQARSATMRRVRWSPLFHLSTSPSRPRDDIDFTSAILPLEHTLVQEANVCIPSSRQGYRVKERSLSRIRPCRSETAPRVRSAPSAGTKGLTMLSLAIHTIWFVKRIKRSAGTNDACPQVKKSITFLPAMNGLNGRCPWSL